ncbi:MAG TPA: hypothetical protein VEA37_14615 [Flavobacterium sp.]|nr:hypothetical protein [Flavobacterium sp.]
MTTIGTLKEQDTLLKSMAYSCCRIVLLELIKEKALHAIYTAIS